MSIDNDKVLALADAPPIPAWLIDADQSRVWAAAWETLYRAIGLAQLAEAVNPDLCPACKTWPVDDDSCPNCGREKPFTPAEAAQSVTINSPETFTTSIDAAQEAVAWRIHWPPRDIFKPELTDDAARVAKIRALPNAPMIEPLTHPQAAPAQGDGWRLCYSAVIHALAAIVNIRCPDKLFDLDAIPRGPVMDQVVLIREAMDRFGKELAAAPSQEGES